MKKVYLFLVTLISLFVFSPFVYAGLDDYYKAGNNLSVSGEKDGTCFFAGNDVNTSADVSGILFASGNNVDISGSSDYLFLAGNVLDLDNHYTNDAFIAGNTIDIKSSTISRDLYVGGSSIKLDGEVGRNAYLSGGDVTIDGDINGNVSISANVIHIGSNAVIDGTLKYNDDAMVVIDSNASIGDKITYTSSKKDSGLLFDTTSLIFRIVLSCNLVILSLIMLFLLKHTMGNIKTMKFNVGSVCGNIFIGLAAIILIPIISVILMCTVIGTLIGIILMIAYIVLLLTSGIYAVYHMGSYLFSKTLKNDYLTIFISMIIFEALTFIPVIGIILNVIATLAGFGIITKLLLVNKEK